MAVLIEHIRKADSLADATGATKARVDLDVLRQIIEDIEKNDVVCLSN